MLRNQNWTVIEFIKKQTGQKWTSILFDFLFFQVGQKGWTPFELVCHSYTGVAASVLYNITVLCCPVKGSLLLPALNPRHQVTYTLHHINFTGCKTESDECSSSMCTLYKGIRGEFLDLYVLKVRSIKTSPLHQCWGATSGQTTIICMHVCF